MYAESKRAGNDPSYRATASRIGIAGEASLPVFMRLCSSRFAICLQRTWSWWKPVPDSDMGFIAMKGLAGGLIHNSPKLPWLQTQFYHVLPIWGIQKVSELEELLSYMECTPFHR